MKRSQAWKDLEREVARVLSAQRVLRGADFSESDVDVKVADFPELKVDCKYRKNHAHHTLVEEVAQKYCKDGDVPVLVTKHHRQQGANVTLPLWYFALLIQKVRMARAEAALREKLAANEH